MARMMLSLETLKDFDAGKAHVAFSKALARVVQDCLDRPGESAPRQVILETTVVPVQQQDGDVIDADVQFTIKAKVPAWKTAARPTAVTTKGQLLFNDLAPDNPHQRTIDQPAD